MTIGTLVGTVGLSVIWLAALVTPRTRTWPFAGFLVLASLLVFLAPTLFGDPGRAAAVVIACLAGAAVISPSFFGLEPLLAYVGRRYAQIEALNRRNREGPGEPVPLEIRDLAASPPSNYWAIAARLSAWRVTRSLAPRETPEESLRQAALDYLTIASWQRVIGARRGPTVRDEDVLLRSLSEQFSNLISTAQMVAVPAGLSEAVVSSARRLLSDTRACLLTHAASRRARDALVESMQADLSLANGERSQEAVERQRLAVAAVTKAWIDLGEP
jgi:hypothetical protein